jgi:hypothetical protein
MYKYFCSSNMDNHQFSAEIYYVLVFTSRVEITLKGKK